MESINCRQCGLVNWPKEGAISCLRCGGPIWKRNDYAAGLSFDGQHDGEALFSGIIMYLTIFLGVALLVLMASKTFQLGGTDVAKIIGVPIGLIGMVASIAMSIWFLVRVFGESVGWGLAAMFLPFGGLVALIKFWDRTHRPFVGHLICVGILFAGIFICS